MTQTAFFQPLYLYNYNMRACAEDEIVAIHFSVLGPNLTTNLSKMFETIELSEGHTKRLILTG